MENPKLQKKVKWYGDYKKCETTSSPLLYRNVCHWNSDFVAFFHFVFSLRLSSMRMHTSFQVEKGSELQGSSPDTI